MVIGQNGKAEDIELNVCKTKHLTNTRSSSADEALKLTPPRVLSLEQAIEFIDTDELLEVTPQQPSYPQEDPGFTVTERELLLRRMHKVKIKGTWPDWSGASFYSRKGHPHVGCPFLYYLTFLFSVF